MKLRTAAAEHATLKWTKSSYSSNDGPDCIEVAVAADAVHVRDSKDVARPGFTVSPTGWTAFTAYAVGQEARRPAFG